MLAVAQANKAEKETLSGCEVRTEGWGGRRGEGGKYDAGIGREMKVAIHEGDKVVRANAVSTQDR